MENLHSWLDSLIAIVIEIDFVPLQWVGGMVWYGCGLSTLWNLLGLDGNGNLLSRKKSPDTAVVSEKDRQLSHWQEEYVSWNLLKKIVPGFFFYFRFSTMQETTLFLSCSQDSRGYIRDAVLQSFIIYCLKQQLNTMGFFNQQQRPRTKKAMMVVVVFLFCFFFAILRMYDRVWNCTFLVAKISRMVTSGRLTLQWLTWSSKRVIKNKIIVTFAKLLFIVMP